MAINAKWFLDLFKRKEKPPRRDFYFVDGFLAMLLIGEYAPKEYYDHTELYPNDGINWTIKTPNGEIPYPREKVKQLIEKSNEHYAKRAGLR